MKKTCTSMVLILAFSFVPFVLRSQGTVYLSNLGESSIGGSVQGGEQSFETGANGNGYALNSIILLMGNWEGVADNFNVSLYNDINGAAGVSLGVLNGNSDPETAGQYLYTALGIILNPATPYWIVATCDRTSQSPPFPNVGYVWEATASANYDSANGWNVGANVIYAPVPSSGGTSALLQFEVDATPVPEPSIFGLLTLGFLFFIVRRPN